MASNASSSTQLPSKRWTYFQDALQLAIHRSAHKWTYEDFTECFALWCEEEPENASRVFTQVTQHMESSITENCERLLNELHVKENLDRLHAVVTEARARKKTGYDGQDVWREDLRPNSAVWARTVPLLERERDRLKAELASLDTENLELQTKLQSNVKTREEVDGETSALLDMLEEIRAKWSELPIDDIQSWTLGTAETVTSSRPSVA
ncbi:hypothetical protein B0H21DRAFT_700275 [Amylocystis lapponica]|nr:hypothetical protein B0H21DRAFT_700275 [Amylocystis lapponica]